MPETFPRLLVATEYSPNSSGGGGAILRQMLKGWPVEKLFWWSCLPETDQRFGQIVAQHTVAKIPGKLYPQRRARFQRAWLMETVWSRHAAQHLQKTLNQIQPEAIWVIPHAWSIPPMGRVLLPNQGNMHVSIHDYMDTHIFTSRFGQERCRRMASVTDRLYAAARTRDGICQNMLDDLKAHTGTTGGITRAGLEAEDFAFLETPPNAPTADLRIAYAGSIQVEAVFHVFVAALQKIRPHLPRRLTLEFFGNTPYQQRPWFDPSWMTVHGNLPLPDLSTALKQCTWGFSPMDLTDDDARYNRFSLPTKLISYLAAGLPVITLGHPASSIVQLASRHAIGLCSSDANVNRLAESLLDSLSEPDPGAKFRMAIRQCARMEFNAAHMRAILHDNLRVCAHQSAGEMHKS